MPLNDVRRVKNPTM